MAVPGQSTEFNQPFKEYLKNPKDKTSIWYYFLRDEKGQHAKCKNKDCLKILKCSGSTTTLHNHIRAKHKQFVEDKPSLTVPNLPGPTPSKSKKLTNYFPKQELGSLDLTLARMIAKDGLPFSIFVTSEDLRNAIRALGFSDTLPQSSTTIRNNVMKYATQIREEQRSEIQHRRNRGEKFCVAFDEWSSSKNRRFMNVIIKGRESLTWNLGLCRIKGSMTSEAGLQIVEDKLESYNLDMTSDIVSIITDGTSVMTKIGLLSPTLQQLCLAHGVQLAVTDVLYKKASVSENSRNDEGVNQAEILIRPESTNEDEDVSSDDEDIGFQAEQNYSEPNITHEAMGPLIAKVRKIVKMFRKSPLKNETLQKHVKVDFGKEMQLVLDSKTRWSSLFNMLDRFHFLRNCIRKSLIDLKEDLSFEDYEIRGISNLVEALGPLKLTVEALCCRDADLLKADVALNFTIGKLEELETGIAQEMAQTFRKRIAERRTDISGVLQYLFTGNAEMDDSYDDMFKMPSKSRIAIILKNLLSRLNPSCVEEEASHLVIDAAEDSNTTCPKKAKTALQDELKKALESAQTRAHTEKCQSDNTLLSTIKKEMALFEAGGARGYHLQNAFDHLKTICPTSVESERAFSSAGYICNKVRSSLRDDTLDELCFLRSHFQNFAFSKANT